MNLEEICLPIKSELKAVEEVIRQKLASPVPFVTNVAEYVVQNGGKRLRPVFCLFSSRLAGAIDERSIDCAAAMEFFHTATLMHDDVIDSADLRRGKPASNSRWGNQVAVLVGDFFYCRASDLLVKTGNLQIISLITQAMRITTEGEILEMEKSHDLKTSKEDYLKIIEWKTAVLMSASCEIGAILGKISEELSASLRNFGLFTGMAFQLADDLLDYVSDDRFGKTQGIDLKEGKLTLPLIIALQQANDAEQRLIKDALISQKMDRARLKEITSIIQKYDGLTKTRELAQEYVEKAKDALNPFKPCMEKESLFGLASYAVDRNV